jgi:hypothetical protein
MGTTAAQILGCPGCRRPPASTEELVLEPVRSLYYESQEGYALYRCRHCAQAYLEEFQEISDWSGSEDDLWQWWMPLTTDELAEVNRLFPNEMDDYDEVPRLTALMQRRARLTKDPQGCFYWSDEGWEPLPAE